MSKDVQLYIGIGIRSWVKPKTMGNIFYTMVVRKISYTTTLAYYL